MKDFTRNFTASLLALLIVVQATAQVDLSTSVLDFGDVMTDAPQSLSFTIDNNFTWDITLDLVSYNQAFSADVGLVTLTAGGSQTVNVTFSPRHNIQHNSELVIYTNGNIGNIPVDLLGRGVYPDTYYAPTQDLSEEALKSALTTLISGHTSLGYTTARDSMYMAIDNHRVNGIGGTTQNKLVTAYTGRIVEGYANRSDAQTNYSVNTEHTYPQSSFSSNEPMRSDLFHIFVTDVTANSQRGNLPFGYVSSPTWTNGGSKKNSTNFEPRDVQKGPASRAMLYFLLRYGNLGSYVNTGDEAILVEWCDMYPPDTVEMRRNEAIFGDQGNRNPLIDHPEFTERIHSFHSTAVAPVEASLVITDSTAGVNADENYPVLFVADGNTDINLTDLAVSPSEFSIVSAPSTIAAGESGIVLIDYTPAGSGMAIVGELTFTTNADEADSVLIQLTAGASPTGIDSDLEPAIAFDMQPNPTTGSISISLPERSSGSIVLYNLDGAQQLRKQFTDSHDVVLDLSEISTGTYLISVETNDGIGRKRIIKM